MTTPDPAVEALAEACHREFSALEVPCLHEDGQWECVTVGKAMAATLAHLPGSWRLVDTEALGSAIPEDPWLEECAGGEWACYSCKLIAVHDDHCAWSKARAALASPATEEEVIR